MRFLLASSLGLAAMGGWNAIQAQDDAERQFLRLASAEAVDSLGRAYPPASAIPADWPGEAPTQPVGHEASNPVLDGYAQWRMEQPTPVAGHGFAGVSPANYSTLEPSATIGPRLDATYWIVRSAETGVFLSERQDLFLGGGTILPIQTPCWLVGVRGMGGWADNLSVVDGEPAYSIDAFIGSRYKTLYYKVGFLMDDFDTFCKMGVAASTLTELPVLGACTADMAYGFRNLPDQIFPDSRDPVTFRSRRVEQCEHDFQLRIGKFCTERFQIGATYNYYDFRHTEDEWGAGGFVSVNLGRFQFTGDVTGGEEGLRGYVRLAWSFGAHPCDTPRDCRVTGVNTIAWVSRPTDRDQSIRLRESFTGPLPPTP